MKTAPKSFLARLSRYFDLQGYVENFKPKKYGDNEYAIDCPACEARGENAKEKLWVNVEKRLATCYKCNEGYDVIGLIELMEDTTNLLHVIEILRDNSQAATRGVRAEVEHIFRVMNEAQGSWKDEALPAVALPRYFQAAVNSNKLPRYFAERNIPYKRAVRYDLGWCTDGFFKNRLVVPVVQNGELVTYHARYMKKQPPLQQCRDCFGSGKNEKGKRCRDCKGQGKVRAKKVLYPKGSKTSRMLFNIDRARDRERIVLCEDVFSAMAVGVEGVGTFGTSLSKYQLALLLTTAAREIVVMWDRDAIDKAYEEADRLAEHWSVRVVKLPDVRDPDEHSRASIRRMIERARIVSGARLFADRVRSRLASI